MNDRRFEELGEPDIQFSELQVWIHDRQFPECDDYWDGNWLRVIAHYGAEGADVWTAGPIVHLGDLVRWLQALEELNRNLTGQADLISLEPELSVKISVDILGQLLIEVEITPNHMSQKHWFQSEADQSYLPPLITGCRRILKNFPLRGKP
jgi:hypothetical protein